MFKHRDRSSVSLLSALLAPGMACDCVLGQIQFGEPQGVLWRWGSATCLIHDVNADGLNDIVVGTSVYVNRGQGRFPLGGSVSGLRGVVRRVGDLDGDGTADFVATRTLAASHWLEWWSSSANRVWSLPTPHALSSLVLCDFDRDGDLDVVAGEYLPYSGLTTLLRCYRNDNGMLTQSQVIQLPANAAWDLVAGDVNGDDWPDLAVVNADGDNGEYGFSTYRTYLVIHENDRRGGFARSAVMDLDLRGIDNARELEAGDMDGDGDLDFVVGVDRFNFGMDRGKLLVVTNNGNGRSFTRLPHVELIEDATRVAIADFNTDGRLDLAVISGRYLILARNLGGMRFRVDLRRRVGGWNGSQVYAGELTGDGRVDLLVGAHDDAVKWSENVTPYSGPELLQSDLVRGRQAGFGVSGAQPHELVHFLFSLEGEGHSVGQPLLGGMTLNLLHPIMYLGSARADAQGRAGLVLHIPPDAPRGTVTTQAVMRRGLNGEDSVKTPFHTALILDP
ncbi:MAG: VCBS repeat-containing protein [Phycisphaerales bacterium]|nr:VCBS repeat-containing protein [Phycisphaerales bacterium]